MAQFVRSIKHLVDKRSILAGAAAGTATGIFIGKGVGGPKLLASLNALSSEHSSKHSSVVIDGSPALLDALYALKEGLKRR